ncbi:MAG: hypothetical protein M1825_002829 [Sarcosagium campestre]|nr:MAG: hypothetical protein M1825_002829 [Sarcosagium campestre]
MARVGGSPNIQSLNLLSLCEPKSKTAMILTGSATVSDHIKELNNARPKQPFFFLKPSSSILTPGAGPVLRPKGVNLHYEVELAVIMGKDVKDLDESDEGQIMDAIEGYAVGIDMTARNLQDEAKKKGLPWSTAKGFDTFLPISNFIPKTYIPNPHQVQLYLSVNDRLRQSDSTELMLFRIPRLISDISKVMQLERGDVVLTGTPKGVGAVQTGDIMRAGVKVGDNELDQGRIQVTIDDREGLYECNET